MRIRFAIEANVPDILSIYNYVIMNSTAVYTKNPSTIADRLHWLRSRYEQGYPVLVAEDQGETVGVASFGDFRAWPGYRFTVEHSIYVRPDRHKNGIASGLLEFLLVIAERKGKHAMIGDIDAENNASVRLHQRLAFEYAGRLKEVGFKFGRWSDLLFVQKILSSGTA